MSIKKVNEDENWKEDKIWREEALKEILTHIEIEELKKKPPFKAVFLHADQNTEIALDVEFSSFTQEHADVLLKILRESTFRCTGPAINSLKVISNLAKKRLLSHSHISHVVCLLNECSIDVFEDDQVLPLTQETLSLCGIKTLEVFDLYVDDRRVYSTQSSKIYMIDVMKRICDSEGLRKKVFRIVKKILQGAGRNSQFENESIISFVEDFQLKAMVGLVRRIYENGWVKTGHFDLSLFRIGGDFGKYKNDPLIRNCCHCTDPFVVCEAKGDKFIRERCEKSNEIAKRLLGEKNYDEALVLFEEVKGLAGHRQFREMTTQAKKHLAKCYYELKMFERAYVAIIHGKSFKSANREILDETSEEQRMLNQCEDVLFRNISEGILMKKAGPLKYFEKEVTVKPIKFKIKKKMKFNSKFSPTHTTVRKVKRKANEKRIGRDFPVALQGDSHMFFMENKSSLAILNLYSEKKTIVQIPSNVIVDKIYVNEGIIWVLDMECFKVVGIVQETHDIRILFHLLPSIVYTIGNSFIRSHKIIRK